MEYGLSRLLEKKKKQHHHKASAADSASAIIMYLSFIQTTAVKQHPFTVTPNRLLEWLSVNTSVSRGHTEQQQEDVALPWPLLAERLSVQTVEG